jgi:hypothetical protein
VKRDAATTQRGVYRRRLALAAVASLALHLLLAKSLTITHLRSDVAPDSQANTKPLTPKRKADFPLAVPRSPSAEQPVHERPVEVRIPVPDRQQRPPPTRPPDRNIAERQAEERSEWKPAAQPQAARTATERDTALAAAAATPTRDTTVSSAAAAATAADLTAIEPAAAAAAARVPAPADAAPVPRAAPAPIASRWRPREVALLERLTAPQASPAARSARDREAAAAAAAAAVPRAAASAAAASADASVADIPLPAATSAARAAVAPAARAATTGATGAAATAARPSSAAGDASMSPAPPTASPADTVAGGRTARADAGDQAATTKSNAAAPGRQQAATAPGAGAGTDVAAIDLPAATKAVTGVAGAPKPAAGGRPAASSPSSALAGGPRGAASEPEGAAPARIGAPATVGGAGGSRGMGTGRTGDVDATAVGAGSTPGRTAPTAAAADDGPPLVAIAAPPTATSVAPGGGRPAPAAIGRFAAGGAVATAGSAVARPRGDAANDAEEEGLSVTPGDASLPTVGSAARRAEADPGAAEALPPARVAAAALPAEGRVRDVAEAFARRAVGRRGSDRQDTPTAAQAATMVDRGLDFLARSQQKDGRWSLGTYAGVTPAEAPKLRSDTAATGLALLGFLGAGHDHFDGPHRDTVRRGLEFLLAAQKPDGDLFLPADDLSNSCAWLYSHGIAAIALCEAVGMTGDPRVKPAAEKACSFIAASQHPTRGGWRYTPRSDADLSVSGWMLVAVRSGELGGLKTDPRTLDGVRGLLEAAASKTDSARYAYNPFKPEQRMSPLSSACMTAVGALMRLHTGAAADDPRVVQAARALAAMPPDYGTATRKTRDSYLWYYASQVLVHTGGPEWERWYGRLVATLAATQESAGPQAGSWDPLGPAPDRWGIYGGRIYVTALHLLALEVPDRHLPTYSAAKQ